MCGRRPTHRVGALLLTYDPVGLVGGAGQLRLLLATTTRAAHVDLRRGRAAPGAAPRVVRHCCGAVLRLGRLKQHLERRDGVQLRRLLVHLSCNK